MPSIRSFGRGRKFHRAVTFACTLLIVAQTCLPLHAAISYTTVGSPYTQNFDSLPTTPENASLGNTPAGWTDDNASPGVGNFSIEGWYLYHPIAVTEGGFSGTATGNHRMRIGAGTANTGAFMSYGASASTERALGTLASNTLEAAGASQYIALRLTNNTGVTLGQFTLQYTGEQWRDGGAATPVAQTLSFGYAVTTAAPTNIGALTTTPVASLNFTSPVFVNTGSGAAVDGNANNSVISATVAGFTWNPGEDLWLRWNDVNDAGNDHAFALDDLTFSANLPAEVNSVANGLASSGSTWSDGQPAGAGKAYHVINGNTVTLDSPFLGSKLSVESGVVDINASGSNQFFGAMTIEAGGNLTESVAGNVSIGSDATSSIKLNRNISFNLDAGSEFRLKAALTGAGNLDLNAASPGSAANAQAYLDAIGGHTGIVRFNAGKQLNFTETAAAPNIEMNSTDAGGNILWWEPKGSEAAGDKVTFNQPGTWVHAVGVTTPTASNLRLQGPGTFVANAAVTVDLSNTYSREERRFLTSSLQGNGNILVKGTASDPTSATSVDNTTGITLNEFEVGAQGTDPSAASFEPYAGTISTQDYINVEIRRNLPAAKFIVNANGRLETGAQPIPLSVGAGTRMGEVVVNNGGVLEVGFEQANAVGGTFVEGHHVNLLKLTNANGRNGNLTLNSGATLRMQINGTANNQFDRIESQGSVALGGTLDVLVNPGACAGNDPCGATANPIWNPALDETFDIIKLVLPAATGDYDGNGSVGIEDFNLWRSGFGTTIAAGTGADGNRNGVIDGADYVIWRKNQGVVPALGNITGTFSSINIVDPSGYLTGLGYTLQAIYGASTVQLKVVQAAGSGAGLAGAVPEPATIAWLALGFPALLLRRRRRA